ncbi:hypothetical protein [Amycolatopsis sp. SID8362]|uniref:hypothetical protein n=1 Tax=Amycolatopsis sp. SID8362 TaxID=2690346 RepID=UPI0013704100|nr:hypothetical protein [Amycolatopsis sp. SID8362]NBH06098.1 hypothetical protein [Amycolatopsis sp. SID8362]NED42797.1 hypothetical protein [Amycolatopsis sp. SID8362]
MRSLPRRATTVVAASALALSGVVGATPASAQGSCPYYDYCIWVDANFVWPYCYWPNSDGSYWNDWCGSNGGNEHLAANAASSYHNNGAPGEFDSVRSFRQAWYAGDVGWFARQGDKVSWVGIENDDAESHYWYNG